MSELTPALEGFLEEQIVGVLATQTPRGRPRESVVYYIRDSARLISTVLDRRKVRDVQQTGWASLCVMGHVRPFPSATFYGPAEILTEGIGPASAQVAQRFIGAEELLEPQSDEALAAVGRVIPAITIERVAAVNRLDH